MQTVIARDVQDKVHFYEAILSRENSTLASRRRRRQSPSARVVRSVQDLRAALENKTSRHWRCLNSTSTLPQRSQTLPPSSRRRDAVAASSSSTPAPLARSMSTLDQSLKDIRRQQLVGRLSRHASSAASSAAGAASSTGAAPYLKLVKKGDVVKKCQLFDAAGARRLLARRRSLPLLTPAPASPPTPPLPPPPSKTTPSAASKATTSASKVRTHEMGDVPFTKRRLEEARRGASRRLGGGGGGAAGAWSSTPTLSAVPPHVYHWARTRFLNDAGVDSKKQVSFPNIGAAVAAAAAAAAAADQRSLSSRRSSEDGGQRRRRTIDFTVVKPTLLSSARLALRQQQNDAAAAAAAAAAAKSAPTTLAGAASRRATPAWYSDVHCSPSVFAEHRSVFSPAPASASAPLSPPPSKAANSVLSKTPLVRSTGNLSICGLHKPPTPASPPASTSNAKATPASASAAAAAASSKKAKEEATGSGAGDAEADAGGVKEKATPKETTPFDPRLHQPTFRYTPAPPTVRSRVTDLYATYPRRRAGGANYRPPRPPPPADALPAGAAS